MKPTLREQLRINHAYWIPYLSGGELQSEEKIIYKDLKSSRKLDVFGTANFFNFVPLKTAIDYFLKIGLHNVRDYHQHLVDRFLAGLDPKKYDLLSLKEGTSRSSLIVISHKNKIENEKIHRELMVQNIYTALWKGNIRISPHVYNKTDEIDQVNAALNSAL